MQQSYPVMHKGGWFSKKNQLRTPAERMAAIREFREENHELNKLKGLRGKVADSFISLINRVKNFLGLMKPTPQS